MSHVPGTRKRILLLQYETRASLLYDERIRHQYGHRSCHSCHPSGLNKFHLLVSFLQMLVIEQNTHLPVQGGLLAVNDQ